MTQNSIFLVGNSTKLVSKEGGRNSSDTSRLQKAKVPLHGVAEPPHMGRRLQECSVKQGQVLILAMPGVNLGRMLI